MISVAEMATGNDSSVPVAELLDSFPADGDHRFVVPEMIRDAYSSQRPSNPDSAPAAKRARILTAAELNAAASVLGPPASGPTTPAKGVLFSEDIALHNAASIADPFTDLVSLREGLALLEEERSFSAGMNHFVHCTCGRYSTSPGSGHQEGCRRKYIAYGRWKDWREFERPPTGATVLPYIVLTGRPASHAVSTVVINWLARRGVIPVCSPGIGEVKRVSDEGMAQLLATLVQHTYRAKVFVSRYVTTVPLPGTMLVLPLEDGLSAYRRIAKTMDMIPEPDLDLRIALTGLGAIEYQAHMGLWYVGARLRTAMDLV